MLDKKSCENCEKYRHCPGEGNDNLVCGEWERNPSMWLSILPTVPGWYWVRQDNKEVIIQVVRIAKEFGHGLFVLKSWQRIEDIKCEWQGPIKPKE